VKTRNQSRVPHLLSAKQGRSHRAKMLPSNQKGMDSQDFTAAASIYSRSEAASVVAVEKLVFPKFAKTDLRHLPVSTIGICADNCKLISRSTRRSIWYHSAVFLAEIIFSNTGTYFMRNARICCSTAVDLFM
jgi:hypothetical protein